jgi:hypothetical protein
MEMMTEIPVSEYRQLNRIVGFWEGASGGLENVSDEHLRAALTSVIRQGRELSDQLDFIRNRNAEPRKDSWEST